MNTNPREAAPKSRSSEPNPTAEAAWEPEAPVEATLAAAASEIPEGGATAGASRKTGAQEGEGEGGTEEGRSADGAQRVKVAHPPT